MVAGRRATDVKRVGGVGADAIPCRQISEGVGHCACSLWDVARNQQAGS